MPLKFSIGLGNVAAGLSNSVAGTTVQVFSGSVYDSQRPNITTGLGSLVGAVSDELNEILTPTISSMDSAVTFHSTLFEDFGLTAESVYNFYTSDELTAGPLDPSASLDQLPRYVRLSWNATPKRRVFELSTKGIAPPDARQRGTMPVLQIGQAKTSVANGFVSPGVLSALIVPPATPTTGSTFSEDSFLTNGPAGAHAVDHIGSDEFRAATVPPADVRLRVNFVDPSIAGALDENRIAVASDQVHLTTLGSLAKIVPSLEVVSEFNQDASIRNSIPTFPAQGDVPSILYVGYVLERYTLDSSGAMTLTRTFDIDDLGTSGLIDRDVVFGGRYAYRIKTVAQWSRPRIYDFFGKSVLFRDPLVDTSLSIPTWNASFYSGQWSDWSRTEVRDTLPPVPPDELIVRPVSPKGQIHVAWKMPYDPQRDISALRLVRSVVRDGRYSDWELLGEFVPGNGLYVDTHVVPFEDGHASYMYAMYSVSYHQELSTLSERVEARIGRRTNRPGERPLRFIGPAGDSPLAHAAGPDSPPETEVVAQGRAAFYVRGAPSSLPLFDRTYVVEVQSLATGERAEVTLAVDATDVDLTPGGVRRRA